MGKSDRFDGVAVNLTLDDEGDWLALFVELPSVSAIAETPVQALIELAAAWEGIKESYRNPPRVHRAIQCMHR
jgi:predicted RNase H-like HicB family nuclease